MSKEEILLHVCCAPCAAPCCERLLDEGRKVTLFFSNSNIDTGDEFEKRLGEIRRLADIMDVFLEVDGYEHGSWLDSVKGLENEPEKGRRCVQCFKYNLKRSAERASTLGIGSFATTLTVSPHKNSKTIFEAGSAFSGFAPLDFKKNNGFARSVELARKYNFYRQSYCGCEFSKR